MNRCHNEQATSVLLFSCCLFCLPVIPEFAPLVVSIFMLSRSWKQSLYVWLLIAVSLLLGMLATNYAFLAAEAIHNYTGQVSPEEGTSPAEKSSDSSLSNRP